MKTWIPLLPLLLLFALGCSAEPAAEAPALEAAAEAPAPEAAKADAAKADADADADADAVDYTCPMHPEVVQKGPGSCPKCKMDLVVAGNAKADEPAEGAAHDHGSH